MQSLSLRKAAWSGRDHNPVLSHAGMLYMTTAVWGKRINDVFVATAQSTLYCVAVRLAASVDRQTGS